MSRYDGLIRPVWAEIDLAALRHNLAEIKRIISAHAGIMAVVKAEAYGHGAVEVAKTAIAAGAGWLGVSLPEEGIALRQAGVDAPMLVFGPLQVDQVETVVKYKLTATVCLLEAAAALSREAIKMGQTAMVHVKVDTGMGRVGVKPEDTVYFFKKISSLPGIKVTGIFSHLATADEADKTYAKHQLRRFTEVLADLKTGGLLPEKIHLANSAGIIDIPAAHFNLVRPGIILYGLYPSPEVNQANISLKPVLALKAKVTFIKRVTAGMGISYGQKYHTPQETTIATIPIGYADGWSRLLSNKANALIGGKKYPIVGTICMDQCMIDVGDDPVEVGQEVVLIGTQGGTTISAEEVAASLGTINYEVTCMLSDRVPRIYLNQDESETDRT